MVMMMMMMMTQTAAPSSYHHRRGTINPSYSIISASSSLLVFIMMTTIMMSSVVERCDCFAINSATATTMATVNPVSLSSAFLGRIHQCQRRPRDSQKHERKQQVMFMSSMQPPDEEDSVPDPAGADIAAALFAAAQAKGVSLDANDLMDDDDDDEGDDDDDDDDDDDIEPNIPQGAINAFLGYDTGDVGEKLSGNVSLTNDQLYSEVKERVLDTAGGFVDMVRGVDDDDEEDDEESDGRVSAGGPKPYVPPINVPDSDLTAGEVILLVLEALKNNDNPTVNKGVEILFGYSSSGSQIKNEDGLTPSEYADFLKETEYNVLFEHSEVTIEKGDYSFDGKKAFFTARLQTGPKPLDFTSCNFQLSSEGIGDDAAWLIDSILIRPQSMRRRRRK